MQEIWQLPEHNFENIPYQSCYCSSFIRNICKILRKKNILNITNLTKRYKDANLPSHEIIDLNKI